MNSVDCYCGNTIVGSGEKVTCGECGRVWWLMTVDERVLGGAND